MVWSKDESYDYKVMITLETIDLFFFKYYTCYKNYFDFNAD